MAFDSQVAFWYFSNCGYFTVRDFFKQKRDDQPVCFRKLADAFVQKLDLLFFIVGFILFPDNGFVDINAPFVFLASQMIQAGVYCNPVNPGAYFRISPEFIQILPCFYKNIL